MKYFSSQLSATDVSAQVTMKGAAKCDNHCELQNSENQQNFERTLCCWVIPGSIPASVSAFLMLERFRVFLWVSNACRTLLAHVIMSASEKLVAFKDTSISFAILACH